MNNHMRIKVFIPKTSITNLQLVELFGLIFRWHVLSLLIMSMVRILPSTALHRLQTSKIFVFLHECVDMKIHQFQ